jgi:hypothetical protein
LQNAEGLGDGGDADIEVDFIKREGRFEEYLRITPSCGVGTPLAHQPRDVEL